MATTKLTQYLVDAGIAATSGRSRIMVETSPESIALDVARVRRALADVAVNANVVGTYDGRVSQIVISRVSDAQMGSRGWTSIREEAARLFDGPVPPTMRDVRRFGRRCVANAEAERARRRRP